MRGTLVSPMCLVGLLLMMGCGGKEVGKTEEAGETMTKAAAAEAVMVMPVSTSSEEAREYFLQGQYALDMGRTDDAHEQFQKAVEADPDFAYAYLDLAFSGNSLEEFLAGLDAASAKMANASEPEQLLIQIAQQFRKNNLEQQLQLSRRLVEVAPESPRAWLQLAGVQSAMNHEGEARQSSQKAIELAPNFAPAYMQLGNSYLFVEPRDLTRAEEMMKKAMELAPNESQPHDLLGDVFRMQGTLEEAGQEYTRAAELDPDNAGPLQQRGHVNTFLGNYDQARADYDSSIALGTPNQKATFAVYRAFVSVHAGQPAAAVQELAEVVKQIDELNVPNARGNKIFALTSEAQIALHSGMYDVAEQALQQRAELTRANAEEIGTEEAALNAQADKAIWEGRLAARRGEYEAALQKAQEAMRLRDPIKNPTKNQPVHELMGLVSLLQGNYEDAIAHYQQANPNDIYATYHLALALEGAGRTAEAQELFKKVANWRFNAVGLALVRADALKKIS